MNTLTLAEADQWYSDEIATFGDRIAGAREGVGLDQKELAARLGVKLQTVLDWEHDLNDPRANKLQTLAGVLNVSISWLLTGDGDGPVAPTTQSSGEVSEILGEMSTARTQIADLTSSLATLENRLRVALKA